jgi:enoyl-CoA hydratase
MYKWIKQQQHIAFAVADNIARITLNRPEKRNALSVAMIAELSDALREADDRLDVSVIIIEGAGGNFCSGYDVTEGSYASTHHDPDVRYRSDMPSVENDYWTLREQQAPLAHVFTVHKPVIAKIEGYCLAGGCELALMCDILLAANDARLGHPGVRGLGTPPNNFFLYHLGPQWAKRLLLTGDRISGKDAAKIGMVLRAYPAARLEAEVVKLARQMCNIDTELLCANKRAVNLGLEMAGAKAMLGLTPELDARSHAAQGPKKDALWKAMQKKGAIAAIRERDAMFGEGMVKLDD